MGTRKHKAAPMFKLGDMLQVDSRIEDKGQPLIGVVDEMRFGWEQRDGKTLPIWAYRLDFPNVVGSPIVWFPESYLSLCNTALDTGKSSEEVGAV